VLKEVDLIAAEDTRQTIKLLNHFDIKKPLVSYYEHNKVVKGNYLVERLLEGKTLPWSPMPALRESPTRGGYDKALH